MKDDKHEAIVRFFANGNNNAMSASGPTLRGLTSPSQSIAALLDTIKRSENIREMLRDAVERGKIRERILE